MRGIEGAPLLPRGRFGLESARFGLGGSGHIWHAAFYRLVDAALFVPAMPRTGEGYELPRPRAGIAAGMRPDAYNFFILISMNYMENGGWGGIRTHDTLLTYTHFPGARLRPLGHPSTGGTP